jgi:hypothetical protein
MHSTVLIISPNDPEAIMINELAKAMGIQVIRSSQPHGAMLDREPDIFGLVKAGGWKSVVIVEMPGPKMEAKLRQAGVEVAIIDHHHYTDLDRAHDPKTKKILLSSLEQFLKMFRVTDAKLRALGYDPKLVRGIAIWDRGFIWALREEGYSERDVRRVIEFQRELLKSQGLLKDEDRKMAQARKAWDHRQRWNGFYIVTDDSQVEIRPRVSMIVALEVKKPTPIIFIEKKRGLIYVQESPQAMALFKKFGGFTFGLDRNWGYRNVKGKPQVTLEKVKELLAAS